MRTNERLALVEQIETAVAAVRDAVDCNDCKEIADWATTVQLRTAELVATVMSELRNER